MEASPFNLDLDAHDPLKPVHGEDVELERQLIAELIREIAGRFVDYDVLESNTDEGVAARNTVGLFWIDRFGTLFRERCGKNFGHGVGLRPDLYKQMKALANGARLDRLLKEMGLENLDTFVREQSPTIEEALRNAGIAVVDKLRSDIRQTTRKVV